MKIKILLSILILCGLVIAAGVFLLYSQSNVTLTEDEAIAAIVAIHPELEAYKTTSLPPSSIETKSQLDGWSVAFVQRGSGVPGILQAQCYHVKKEGSVVATGQYTRHDNIEADIIKIEDCTLNNVPSSKIDVLPYGKVMLKIGSAAQFKDISIKPISIEEDSRCPSDVQCIWAGTVRVKIQTVSGMKTSTSIVTLDQFFTTEGESVSLTSITPNNLSQTQINVSDYLLTFNVVPQINHVDPDHLGKCYIGGCSAQLCTDQPDAASTCEYTESYACYKTATCKRQENGKCGWTQTPQLTACLINN